ncbi:Purine-cytosine permease FCY2 [Fusarium tjaetaba]|uniref:Purine-cytosine permease FCY2 n=1 Tax=Fusarium tjaetaba TaxID=1567544 RepID=A0A8H5R130_9HYPO|nr:Purine-cytosine permease FCY2 [Fusarium tjaetaba]KAF5624645.1 Purine-cytosine permease FCY2 [Fusarium tjaetaba]
MDEKKTPNSDIESFADHGRREVTVEEGSSEEFVFSLGLGGLLRKLAVSGVEMRGLEPVPVEKRTHTKYYNIFTLFGGSFTSILPLSIGTTPTLVFGQSFRDAAIMIVTMQALFVIPTLYILTLAPQLGMRQSVQFRYVFGKYLNALLSIIIILEIGIYAIIAAVGGAECLSAVRPGTLPVEAAIAIIFTVAFCIAFVGYSAVHFVCQYIWIPNIIALLVLVGCAGSQLHNQAPASSSGAAPWLATVSICASNMATWGTIIGDYTCYMPPKAPKLRLVFYCVMGLYVPFTLFMLLGAAIGGSITVIPSWGAAYAEGSLGGVLGQILTSRVGGFGRFLLVILGFSIVTTSARDMYSISLFTVAVIPWLRHVPRVLILVFASGVMIGVGIAASRSFLPSLSTLVSIAGYITAPSVSVFLVEWFVFRKANPASVDPAIWDNPSALPSGIPAVISIMAPWGLIVPSMSTVWYVGPIAARVGDLAWELGALANTTCELIVSRRGKYGTEVALGPFSSTDSEERHRRFPVERSPRETLTPTPTLPNPRETSSLPFPAGDHSQSPPKKPCRDVSPSLSEIAVHKDPERASERVIYIGDSANYQYVLHEVGDPFKGSDQNKYWIENLQRSMLDQIGSSTQDALQQIRSEDDERLRDQGVFQYPEKPIRDELIRVFFDYSCLACPIFYQVEFMRLYKADSLSPLILNAVFFMATLHCSEALLAGMGFPNRYLAGLTFYRRAKALYDADYESDGIVTVQAAILLSHRWDGPTEQKDTWHWLGIATGLAQSLGMHRRLPAVYFGGGYGGFFISTTYIMQQSMADLLISTLTLVT